MNKRIVQTIVLVAAMALIIAPAALAKKGGLKPLKCNNSGPAGKSKTAHLYLYPDTLAPGLAKGESWAKMKYNLSGPALKFVFNAKSLTAETDYTLITYVGGTMEVPDPEHPGEFITVDSIAFTCLDSGTANGGGNVHINNSLPDIGDLTDAEILLVETADLPEGACSGTPIEAATVDLASLSILEGCDPIDFDDTEEPLP